MVQINDQEKSKGKEAQAEIDLVKLVLIKENSMILVFTKPI